MEAIMNTINYTKHAIKRSRQRGILDDVIRLVADYGTQYCHKGCEITFLAESDIKFLESELNVRPQILDKCKRVYLVMSKNTLITAAHVKTKFKHNYWH